MCYIKAQRNRAYVGSPEETLRAVFEDADYPLLEVIRRPDEVLWGRVILCGLDDDRRNMPVDALRFEEECRLMIAEGHDPLDVLEHEDKMQLVLWLLKKARMQGIVADPDSEVFITWARSMIDHRHIFEEQAQKGLSS